MKFKKTAQIIDLLIDNKENILDVWLSSKETQNILNAYDIEIDTFRTPFATQLFDCYLDQILGKNNLQDCSVIPAYIKLMLKHHATPDKIFLLPIELENSILKSFFANNLSDYEIYIETNQLTKYTLQATLTEFQKIFNDQKQENIYHNAILETTNDGYWMADMSGNLLEVNSSYSKMSGYSIDELLTMSIQNVEAIESEEETKKHIEHIIQYGNETFETIHIKKNGERYPVEVSVSFSEIEGGRFFVLVRDISERKRDEKELLLSSKVFSNMTDGVVITDSAQHILKVNNSFCKTTGYTEKELLGKSPNLLSSGWHDKEFYKQMWEEISGKGSWQGEIVDRKKNGETYISETSIVAIKKDDEITNYIAISSDISHKKEQEQIINNLAYYDALTKLPNKILFQERFENYVSLAKRHQKQIALLFIDLDNFKNINDTLGHLVGDQFLKDAAMRIKSILREEDTVGRFGGDEFAILVQNWHSLSSLGTLAQKIIDIFKQPFLLESTEFFSGASIGISIYPDDAQTYDEMVRLADTAMYHVKNQGKNNYEFYSSSMNTSIAEKMQILTALHTALENNEFHLTYQPKINIDTNTVYGMEALIRWIHPKLGFISPEIFIPKAEDNGHIYNIGLWVLEKALEDTKKLHDSGFNDLTVSINISSKQLEQNCFLDDFRKIIDKVGLKREFIDLEITETQVMNNIESSLDILRQLSALGIKMSIDDFGTGYSSLNYLKQLPASTIKIDKSFVLDIDKDENDKAIVSSIIALSQSLNKNIVAEGSETEEHIKILKELGVNQVQGYFYSKPLKFEEFESFLKEFR
ncbi:EAL domain-containing protein [Sulfurimonas marina]|uniref:EAL domain-containing protein n=1 Tax=Sulfurimonas marina TaxID=2590551 RepID=A0A7M3V9L5_9BACT|nr:EAL domain-containing protein [Sulfurimonas marina]QOP40448.1 EAL domain-containing protein [Sulfurimonas marina]